MNKLSGKHKHTTLGCSIDNSKIRTSRELNQNGTKGKVGKWFFFCFLDRGLDMNEKKSYANRFLPAKQKDGKKREKSA